MNLVKNPTRRSWKYYHPIPPEQAGDHKDTDIKVEVTYVMGGNNWASGARNPRGYRIDLTRVSRGNGFESFVLLGNNSGVYVMLEQVKSYQEKKLDAWAGKADPVVKEIAEAFLQGDKQKVLRIAEELRGGPMLVKPEAPIAPPPVKELLTADLKEQLLKAGLSGQKAVCKFFNPAGGGTWIISGMDSDGDTLWCLADLGLDCCEQGTVSLKELQETKLPMGLHIERDLHFKPLDRTLTDFFNLYNERGTLAGVA